MIDWNAFWDDFDGWYEKATEHPRCKHCGHWETSEPDWDEQKDKIAAMVDERIGTWRATR